MLILTDHRLKILESKIDQLQRRVTTLECPHKNTKFQTWGEYSWAGTYGAEICADCNKILNSFKSKKEYDKALKTALLRQIKDLDGEPNE